MKKIFSLAVRGVCVMLPMILIWVYTWVNPLGFMTDGTPFDLWNKEIANTEQEKYYEAVFLGDSTANAAYVPEIFSGSSINLALGAITPMESYYILQDWLEHQKAPKVCYISFLDYHMKDTMAFWSRTMYTHRFRIDQNLEMLKAVYDYGDTAIVTDNCATEFLAYELRLPNKYITSLMNAGFNQRYEENVEARRLSALHGGRYIARGTEEYKSAKTIKFKEFEVHPLFDEYYRRLIKLCVDRGIQVRLIKLPLPDNQKFTKGYQDDFHAYYEKLKADYPQITVDWIPTYGREDFADRNHVNSHGALRFSQEIKKRYPGDFTGEVTPAQIEALNDSIADENTPGAIIRWAAGKDYTILFQDPAGEFLPLYGELIKDSSCTLERVSQDQADIYRIDALEKKDVAGISVEDTDGKLLVTLENGESEAWKKAEGRTLRIMVIDNFHDRVVCKKSFRYIENEPELIR